MLEKEGISAKLSRLAEPLITPDFATCHGRTPNDFVNDSWRFPSCHDSYSNEEEFKRQEMSHQKIMIESKCELILRLCFQEEALTLR